VAEADVEAAEEAEAATEEAVAEADVEAAEEAEEPETEATEAS
jgi:hypothetical protein